MILITNSGFSLADKLPGAAGIPIGTSVSRIRTELIFRQCWNLITLGAVAPGISVAANAMAVSGPATRSPPPEPAPAGSADSANAYGQSSPATRTRGLRSRALSFIVRQLLGLVPSVQ